MSRILGSCILILAALPARTAADDPVPGRVRVFIATTDLPAGTVLGPELLNGPKPRLLRVELVAPAPEDAIVDPDKFSGRSLKRNASAGQILLDSLVESREPAAEVGPPKPAGEPPISMLEPLYRQRSGRRFPRADEMYRYRELTPVVPAPHPR